MSKIEVKKSNIHGLGVFATKEIKRRELVTKYPKHFEVVDDYPVINSLKLKQDVLAAGDVGKAFIAECEDLYENEILEKYLKLLFKYKIDSYFGNPFIFNDLRFVGHIINDSTNIDSSTDIDETKIKKYIIDSTSKANCVHSSGKVYAIKNIKKGEELFVSYGFQYWIPNFSNQTIIDNCIKFLQERCVYVNGAIYYKNT